MKPFRFVLQREDKRMRDLKLCRVYPYGQTVGQIWKDNHGKGWVGYSTLITHWIREETLSECRRKLENAILLTLSVSLEATLRERGL